MGANVRWLSQGVPGRGVRATLVSATGWSCLALVASAACGLAKEPGGSGPAAEAGGVANEGSQGGESQEAGAAGQGGDATDVDLGGRSGAEPGGHSGGGQVDGAAGDAPIPVHCLPEDVTVSVDSAVTLGGGKVRATHLLTDPEGNTYVAGSIDEYAVDVDLGGGALVGDGDAFLLKRDAQGAHVWSQRLGTAGDGSFDGVDALAFAGNGDLLVAGYFGAQSGRYDRDVFSARFDPQGTLLSNHIVPTNGAWIVAISETGAGEQQLWGSFTSSLILDDTTLAADGQYPKLFVTRSTADGTITAAQQFGAADYDHALGAATDAAGNSYVAAVAQQVLPSGNGAPTHGLVRAFDSALKLTWERDLGEDVFPRRVAVADGKLLVVGDARPWVQRPDSEALGRHPQIFIARLDLMTGETIAWRTHDFGFSAVPVVTVQSLVVLPDSSLVVGGEGQDYWLLGERRLRSQGGNGSLLARFAASGDVLWATLFCSDEYEVGVPSLSFAPNTGSLHALLPHQGYLELGSTRSLVAGTLLATLPAEQSLLLDENE